MSKIKIMSESLANKIAAGEVVEKCASIVKELVENSIDAKSDSIRVDLISSGIKSIKVTDNGVGMDKEDALLAFERHATSKLINENDLFFINTLGFRGEALPSIASVSEVEIITSTGNIGTKINIKGGKVLENVEFQAQKGTSIEVKNLFYNTPARLKYLKSEQSELANSVSFIERLALSYPDIRFELTNNGNTVVKTSGSGNLLKTIHEIFGLQVSSKMLEIKNSNDDYDIYGFICKPEILKSTRNYIITIVNGRVVRNNEVNKAINEAYFNYKPAIKYPVVVLKIDTDPTLIDVNIHPTKQDIKFSKINELCTLIESTIADKLHEELLVPNAIKNQVEEISLPSTMTSSLKASEVNDGPSVDIKEDYQEISLFEKIEDEKQQENKMHLQINEEENTYTTIKERMLNPKFKKLDLHVVGQILGTYIVCENDFGLYLIDQHAAKERVNYEIVEEAFKNKEITTIDVLIPINIELNSGDFLKIKEHIDIILDLGISIEEFGINTFTIKSHPTWFTAGHEEEIIREIFDEIVSIGANFDRIKFNRKLIATIACKMSVRANTRLSIESMEEIVRELMECKNPYNCAHGRPTIVKFSTYELEKMFKRVMN
ncbi:MAG: DNA mismatch repair endonuclease MutL [Bacilli bacterium]